ncbi:SusC/RagA family TonB-linked outer membrane protein, partial [Enterococcus durans]|nr:SusC/RagA family TonB-linked outer membrane protein [Enterococcus durans]
LSTHYVGKKWGEIWGLVTEGLFQSAEEVSAHADQSEIYGGGWYPGDVKYKDLNGDGKINKGKNTLDDPGDQKIIGNSEPRYSYGIKGGLQWRDFDFDVFFQGIGKKDVVLGGNQFWGFGNEWHVPFKHALDSWTEDNRNAYFPRSTYDNVTGNRETQTRYLQNAAYLRLKSITLGYSLPKALLAKWKIDHVRFYVSGQNLLTFDHLFDIYDPETVSLSTYPLTKSVSFGLNITL